jgi:hypothetical protein
VNLGVKNTRKNSEVKTNFEEFDFGGYATVIAGPARLETAQNFDSSFVTSSKKHEKWQAWKRNWIIWI